MGIDYSEQEGYALISGGAPSVNGNDGKCRTGTGTNNAGLWIFTREQKRNDQLLSKVRAIAEAKGFDLSVLNDVDHSNCTTRTATSSRETIVGKTTGRGRIACGLALIVRGAFSIHFL